MSPIFSHWFLVAYVYQDYKWHLVFFDLVAIFAPSFIYQAAHSPPSCCMHMLICRRQKWIAELPLCLISWQLGLVIRSVTSGHVPPYPFILVTMGSTAVLLIGWRALSFTILPKKDNKSDDHRRGSPFELFEVLTIVGMNDSIKMICFP